MKKYHGSCHCGQVKFIAKATIDKVVSCNCSICTKKGVLHRGTAFWAANKWLHWMCHWARH